MFFLPAENDKEHDVAYRNVTNGAMCGEQSTLGNAGQSWHGCQTFLTKSRQERVKFSQNSCGPGQPQVA